MRVFSISPDIISSFILHHNNLNIEQYWSNPGKLIAVLRSIKDWEDLLQKWYRFSKKEAWLRSVKNKNKSSRYYVQGIDSVWNNEKRRCCYCWENWRIFIPLSLNSFLCRVKWYILWTQEYSTYHVRYSSYKILLQLICLSSLSRNICRSPHRIKNVHAFNLILDMYIIMCEGGYVLCDKQ